MCIVYLASHDTSTFWISVMRSVGNFANAVGGTSWLSMPLALSEW